MTWPLREAARGKPCSLRLLGCRMDPETTVLAHIRTVGTGIGKKPLDTMAVFACSHCHDCIDGRKEVAMMPKEVLGRIIAGLAETHEELMDMGLLKIEKHGTG